MPVRPGVDDTHFPSLRPRRIAARRRIWLCADDYGLSPSVDAAIRDLVMRGRLNATSVMVASPNFGRAEALPLVMLNIAARRVAIGLHVTLTAPFEPYSGGFAPTRRGAFPTLGRMMASAFAGRLDDRKLLVEVATQFQAYIDAFGRPPDFVDGHQHVHLLPQVREAVLTVMREVSPKAWVRQCRFAVPAIRRLGDHKGLLLHWLSRQFREIAVEYDIHSNPAFAGTYDFGSNMPYARLFYDFLDGMPDGGLIMCHPGIVDDELQRLDPVTTQREDEYDYFVGDQFKNTLYDQGYELI
jgi:chitin disaccharide deacetylase